MVKRAHLRRRVFSASVAHEENDADKMLKDVSQLLQLRVSPAILREGHHSVFDRIENLELGLATCETAGKVGISVEDDPRAMLVCAHCIGP
jgi:hypothetical protein